MSEEKKRRCEDLFGRAVVALRDGDSDVFHPERDQVAHYYRFQELKLGRRYRRGDTPRSVVVRQN